METVGKAWAKRLEIAEDFRRADKLMRERRAHEEEALTIISTIPGIIEKAGDTNSVKAFGWIECHDVAGEDPNRVDQLAERLEAENRVLHPDDLEGRAAMVFAWCDDNDLECFLESESVLMNGDEYNFCVRPKKTA